MCKKFVAYYRVSTQKQGHSGLGLDAQKKAVLDYLNGGSWRLVSEFEEVESGRKNDRPALAAALEACRLHGATLVIAKLDRLARNVAFVSQLMESGVDFVAVDFPQANRLTIHIVAAVAEHEREAISSRTKAALAAAKARGTTLGGFRGYVPSEADRTAAAARNVARADQKAARVLPIISEIKASGITSLAGIAAELNRREIEPPRAGSKWHATTVSRLLAR